MGKSTRTLFEKSCFWPILEAFGRFLEVVKGYKRRGDREKKTQQSNARISRLRESEEKARISRLCEREVKAGISRLRESDNSARKSRQREEEDKIKIF